MIAQILRAVFVGIAIYLLTKVAKSFIDKKLDDGSQQGRNDNASNDDARAQLTPCPKCGVYITDPSDHVCEK